MLGVVGEPLYLCALPLRPKEFCLKYLEGAKLTIKKFWVCIPLPPPLGAMPMKTLTLLLWNKQSRNHVKILFVERLQFVKYFKSLLLVCKTLAVSIYVSWVLINKILIMVPNINLTILMNTKTWKVARGIIKYCTHRGDVCRFPHRLIYIMCLNPVHYQNCISGFCWKQS